MKDVVKAPDVAGEATPGKSDTSVTSREVEANQDNISLRDAVAALNTTRAEITEFNWLCKDSLCAITSELSNEQLANIRGRHGVTQNKLLEECLQWADSVNFVGRGAQMTIGQGERGAPVMGGGGKARWPSSGYEYGSRTPEGGSDRR